jgi:hypothetical protein
VKRLWEIKLSLEFEKVKKSFINTKIDLLKRGDAKPSNNLEFSRLKFFFAQQKI